MRSLGVKCQFTLLSVVVQLILDALAQTRLVTVTAPRQFSIIVAKAFTGFPLFFHQTCETCQHMLRKCRIL